MTYKIIGLITAVVVFASCSSVYKSSQTPDDVYYSPAKPRAAYATGNNNRQDAYEDYVSSREDRYLRMRVQNRYRWSSIDDFDYWYNPAFAFNNYYGSYGRYNPYFNNNWYSSYYNPYWGYGNIGWFGSYYPNYGHGYYTPIYVVKNPTAPAPGVARPSLRGYNNGNYNNTNTQRQGLGSLMRKAFTPAYNNSNNNNANNNNRNNNSFTPDRQQQPARTYNPVQSTPSSSPASSSGGGVTRPVRRGN